MNVVLGQTTLDHLDSLIIPSIRPSMQLVKERVSTAPVLPKRLSYKLTRESAIPYPGVRYAVENLKKEKYENPEVAQAIDVLLKYAENKRIKFVIDYLQNYAKQNLGSS